MNYATQTGPRPPFAYGWGSLMALALPLLIVGWTADTANWVPDMLPLWPQALAGLVVGYLVVPRVRNPLLRNIVGIATASVAAYLVGLEYGDTSLTGMAILLAWLTWAVGYYTASTAYGTRRPYLAFVPGLLALLVMLTNLPPSLQLRLLLFVAATGPSVAVFQHPERQAQNSVVGLPVAGLLMAAGVGLFAWATPSLPEPLFAEPVHAAADRWTEFWNRSTSFFAAVPSRREIPRLRLYHTLPMTSPLGLDDAPIMTVEAKDPGRWRLGTYETYSREGWQASPNVTRGDSAAPASDTPSLRARRKTSISVRTAAVMDEIATAGIPLDATIENVSVSSGEPEFLLNRDAPQSTYLPADLEAIQTIIAASPASDDASAVAASYGAEIVSYDESGIVLRRVEDVAPVLSIEFEQGLIPPRSYESLGSVSTATLAQLRTASTDYPRSVADRYLQLPVDFPDSVRDLAASIVSPTDHPYDQAVAVQTYLRNLPYSSAVNAPPSGRDPVEWFLFESQTGFCTYYASAMITMLRSLGIPARLAVGFAPGAFDDDREEWAVNARNYHSWAEVYFPEFGWVEFEPTPPAVQPSLAQASSPTTERVRPQRDVASSDLPCFEDIGCDDPAFDDEDLSETVGTFTPRRQRLGSAQLIWWGVLALALLAALAAAAYLRRIGVAGCTRLQLRVLVRLAGSRRPPNETPAEQSRRLAARLPGHAAHLRAIAAAFDAAAFSESKRLTPELRARLWVAARYWPATAALLTFLRLRGAVSRVAGRS